MAAHTRIVINKIKSATIHNNIYGFDCVNNHIIKFHLP